MTHFTFSVPASIISSCTKSVVIFMMISLLYTGCKPQSEPSIPPQKYTIPATALQQDNGENKDKNDPNENNDSTLPIRWTPAQNRPWTEFTSARDTWDLCFMQGSRVGYGHTQMSPITLADGQKAIKLVSLSHLKVQRYGQTTEVDFSIESTESPRGELISFTERMKNAPGAGQPANAADGLQGTRQGTEGRVEGDQLILTTGGVEKSFPWSNDVGGFDAVKHSLLSSPMKPGERRCLRHLVPMFDTIATTDLFAQNVESVKLLHGTYRLLRIDTTITLPDGVKMTGAVWTDSKGEQLKSYTNLLNQETYLVTREEALAKHKPAKIDLGFDMLVKPDRPLENPHLLGDRGQGIGDRKKTYLVTLDDADPATVFTTGASQTVEPIDAHSARVTVRVIRPGEKKLSENDPPTMADLAPNGYIESNDPVVVAMAKEATKDATTPWEKAVAAERYLHDTLEKANYSQAFATAAETAKSKSGDCTEHAVLLAALGRALGIPSRVVVGLVYSEPLGAFGFHMWTEMYIDGTWVPMDATLGNGGIGVGHLKLGHTTLENGLADSVFFAVPKTLGKLKIKVE